MKVIFLDIDGVLNHEMWDRICREESLIDGALSVDETKIDPAKVGILNQLIVRSGAKIVISSSWRLEFGLEGCALMLKRRGLIGEIIGITPSGECRGDEIEAWLSANDSLNVSSFVILDDTTDMNHVHHRLVKTDLRFGLTLDHVDRALALLSKK